MEQNAEPKIASPKSELFGFLRFSPVCERGLGKPNKQKGSRESAGGGPGSKCDVVAEGLHGKTEEQIYRRQTKERNGLKCVSTFLSLTWPAFSFK